MKRKLLYEYKKERSSTDNSIVIVDFELKQLQEEIENRIFNIGESTFFTETPNLIKLLIGKGNWIAPAKSYLFKYLSKDLYSSVIDPFGQYTLEAIIIYVLGQLYNSIEESPGIYFVG